VAEPSASTNSAQTFDVPAGTSSLSRRTVDAFAWGLLTESLRLVLLLAVQITLARLLPVEAFGLLAVAMLVVNFGSRLSEIGTASAIIQRSELSSRHVRAGFTLALLCGTTMTVAIWFGAPVAAVLFKVPTVTPILRLIGWVFAFDSIGSTAEALMQRRMDYRRLLFVSIVSYGVGYGILGITLSILGFGVWALAWATVAQAVMKSAMLLVLCPHPMAPYLFGRETRELLKFGIGMTLSKLATFAAQNGDYFVVARTLGLTALGLYSRAYQLMCLPIYQFSAILNAVLFPAYSSIQHDVDRLRRGYLTALSVSSIVVFPVLTVLAVAAPEVMGGVFGRQWAPAVVPLQILCAGGACYCIYNLADSLVRAKGAVYTKFLCHTIFALAVFMFARAGAAWGITGVSVGVTSAIAVVYLLMARLSLRLTACTWSLFFRAQLPAVAVSGAAGIAGLLIATALRATGISALVILGATALACGVVALVTVFILPSSWHSQTVRAGLCHGKAQANGILAAIRRRYVPEIL